VSRRRANRERRILALRTLAAPRVLRRAADATIDPDPDPAPEAVFDRATGRVHAPTIHRAFLVMPGGSRTGEDA